MDELEKLRKENEVLKETIKQLRRQLELYRNQQRKSYDYDNDYVPYHERED